MCAYDCQEEMPSATQRLLNQWETQCWGSDSDVIYNLKRSVYKRALVWLIPRCHDLTRELGLVSRHRADMATILLQQWS